MIICVNYHGKILCEVEKCAVITPNTKTSQVNVSHHDSFLNGVYKCLKNRQNIHKTFYKSIEDCIKYNMEF